MYLLNTLVLKNEKILLIVMTIFLSKNVNSLELLCSGEKPRLQNQKQMVNDHIKLFPDYYGKK